MTRPVDIAALTAPVATIEKHLRKTIAELCAEDPPPLREAIEYAVLAGGKRLRPLLSWYWAQATGAPGQASLAAGAAVEFIHAFSLVHDDLPALDNDDLRRGQPTVHRKFGEALAILTGDALLNLSYRAVQSCGDERQASLLSDCLSSATQAMIAGQVYDTLGAFSATVPEIERVSFIHTSKTAALLSASCEMGYNSGVCWLERTCKPRNLLSASPRNYGQSIGLMFQIVDDLLDVTGSESQLGKRTGKDAAAGKLTYPGVIGVEASRREVDRLRTVALEAIEPLGAAAQPLRDLCDYLCVRTQ